MHKKLKSRMLIFWLVTYAVIEIIGVAAVIISYNISRSMMYENTLLNNQMSIERIKEHFDEMFMSLEKTVVISSSNDALSNMAKDAEPIDDYKRYHLSQVAKDVMHYQESLKSVDRAFFYFKNYGMIIGNGSIVDLKDFYMMIEPSCTLNRWEQMLTADTENFLTSVTMRDGEKYFLYVSGNYFKRLYGTDNMTFCALIKGEVFDFLPENTNLSLVAKNTDNVLNINHEMNLYKEQTDGFSDNQGSTVINGENFVYSVIPSDVWNLKYVILTSKKLLFKKLTMLRNMYFLLLFVFIVLAEVLSYWFAKRNSMGWANIIEAFDEESTHFQGRDVFNKVCDEVVSLMKNYKTLQNDSKVHLQKLKEKYIMDLCVSSADGDEFLIGNLKELGLDFPYPYFSLMLIYPQTEENFAVYSYTLKNIARGILERDCKILFSERHCFLICIVNYDSELENGIMPPELADNLRSVAEIVQETLGDRLGEKIYFSISSSVDKSEKIPKAYNEALADMDAKLMSEEEKTMKKPFEEMKDEVYSYEHEILLINAIQHGDETTAVQIVHEIFFTLKNSKEMLSFGIRCFVYDLFCALFRAAVKMGEPAVTYMQDFQYGKRMEKLGLEREYRALVLECVKGLCELRKSNAPVAAGKNVKLEEEITKYIYENYMDCDMGLKKIADRFDMNLSYISASYREKCGIGIAERLEKFRMIKAIEFLEKGEKVTDVAKMVGYQNVRTFSKAFKRNYNVAPSKFNKED